MAVVCQAEPFNVGPAVAEDLATKSQAGSVALNKFVDACSPCLTASIWLAFPAITRFLEVEERGIDRFGHDRYESAASLSNNLNEQMRFVRR
jgi:hypothetical protein